MIKRVLRKNTKLLNSKRERKGLYVLGLNMPKVFDLVDKTDMELSRIILMNIITANIALLIMSQISISLRPESIEYIDNIPSYVDLKRKFITSFVGRTLASCIGFARAFPYLSYNDKFKGEDVVGKSVEIISEMSNTSGSIRKRSHPSVSGWQLYALGEMQAALGQMLSCPSTNMGLLNIDDTEVCNYDLHKAIIKLGFSKILFSKYDINLDFIREYLKTIYLQNDKKTFLKKLVYNEPSNITSKLQNEILGDLIIRDNKFNIKEINSMELGLIQKIKYLDKYEVIAYDFAVKSGDKHILRKYIELIQNRFIRSIEFNY